MNNYELTFLCINFVSSFRLLFSDYVNKYLVSVSMYVLFKFLPFQQVRLALSTPLKVKITLDKMR